MASLILAIIVLIVTMSFFFSGGKEERAEERGQQAPRVEEFTCNANEFKVTVRSGSGYYFRIIANKPWKAFSLRTHDTGEPAEFDMPADESSWRGGDPPGILRVQCLEDGTTLRFERVR